MVPTIRPSANTSILAPTRCGVEPMVETIVTRAAGFAALERVGDGREDFLFISGRLYGVGWRLWTWQVGRVGTTRVQMWPA